MWLQVWCSVKTWRLQTSEDVMSTWWCDSGNKECADKLWELHTLGAPQGLTTLQLCPSSGSLPHRRDGRRILSACLVVLQRVVIVLLSSSLRSRDTISVSRKLTCFNRCLLLDDEVQRCHLSTWCRATLNHISHHTDYVRSQVTFDGFITVLRRRLWKVHFSLRRSCLHHHPQIRCSADHHMSRFTSCTISSQEVQKIKEKETNKQTKMERLRKEREKSDSKYHQEAENHIRAHVIAIEMLAKMYTRRKQNERLKIMWKESWESRSVHQAERIRHAVTEIIDIAPQDPDIIWKRLLVSQNYSCVSFDETADESPSSAQRWHVLTCP